jgi:hypothetical protein
MRVFLLEFTSIFRSETGVMLHQDAPVVHTATGAMAGQVLPVNVYFPRSGLSIPIVVPASDVSAV